MMTVHNDLDLFRVQGYVQARDRFSQMDRRRRLTRGTSADLTGRFSDLTLDASLRAVGIRRAAEQALALLSPREIWRPRAWRDWVGCVGLPLTVRAIRMAEEAALAA